MTGRATGRFPGFDVLGQAPHWDTVTADLVTARTGLPPAPRFFTDAEQACAGALLDQLTGQREEPLGVPVLEMIDARLAASETDGWRYEDLPEDSQAWRDTLGHLDKDAHVRCGTSFAAAPGPDQAALIQAVQDSSEWHGLPAARVWSLWTRYACTALYSHPHAWSEIGFPGPAYPRGYKNAGVGKLEPFEVRDARPAEDPVREKA
ncbi:MAG TPA: gluconate 2-dehydrogenase subunit 3 family protein [Trebonia sp.]|nr:gluconate 2-dehydrogenase subunit 3 family protein [Trebonia sp.]